MSRAATLTRAATLLAALALPLAAAGEEYTIDPSHTYPYFSVAHIGLSVLEGRFDETSGTLTLDRENGTGAVKARIKAASIDTGHAQRDENLRKADYLDVGKYPEITYESTKVTLKGGTGTIEGNLTLHGVTRPVTLDLTRLACGNHPLKQTYTCGFSARGTLKRSDFGMKKSIPMIGDEIELRIEAEAERKERGPGPRG